MKTKHYDRNKMLKHPETTEALLMITAEYIVKQGNYDVFVDKEYNFITIFKSGWKLRNNNPDEFEWLLRKTIEYLNWALEKTMTAEVCPLTRRCIYLRYKRYERRWFKIILD